MGELRDLAKKYTEAKEYSKAIKIYETIISDSENKNLDKWLGWEYANCLKKDNQIDKAINIAKQTYKNNKDFKYIKDLLAWALYEKFFKNLDNNISDKDIKQLCKVGSFILNITQQDKSLPYENTAYRIIKLLYKSSLNNEKDHYLSIYEWLDKLDINKLSKESIEIKSEINKDIQKASMFEEIVYLKIKCLFNLDKYEETKKLATYFIHEINIFHNDRDKWVKRIIANCEWNLDNKEKSLNLLKDIDTYFSNWIIKYELAEKELEMGNLNNAIYYSIKGILGREPINKKKSLVKLQAKILYNLKRYDESKYFNQCCMNINSRLLDREETYKIRQVCLTLLQNIGERKEGFITRVLPNNKAGFIKADKESLYFKKNNSFSGDLKENDKVSFKVINSFDIKKNKKSLEAIDIILVN